MHACKILRSIVTLSLFFIATWSRFLVYTAAPSKRATCRADRGPLAPAPIRSNGATLSCAIRSLPSPAPAAPAAAYGAVAYGTFGLLAAAHASSVRASEAAAALAAAAGHEALEVHPEVGDIVAHLKGSELTHLGALGAPRRADDVEGRGELRGGLPVPTEHRRVLSGVHRMDPARGQEERLTSKGGDVGVWNVG